MRNHDEITSRLKIVSSVSDYVYDLRMLQNIWCEDDYFMVYRGESEEYSTPCIPTIYRGFALKQNANYEKNMFMAMRQNDISKSEVYLHNAIDAQHDGFPSRLLDVTYNALIALYFAVTPYYYKPEDAADGADGIVYVIKYSEALSPEAKNTQDLYESALRGSSEIGNSRFLSYHHRLIDHCKQNKRIIAQQGAFVLFTGETPVPIPYYQMCGIRISHDAKAKIRHELKYMFGIYTGTVYPEVELMQEEVNERCLRINSFDYSLVKTTEDAMDEVQAEYSYFAGCCDYCIQSKEPLDSLIRIIEKSIVTHKAYLKEYYLRLRSLSSGAQGKEMQKNISVTSCIDADGLVEKYNGILSDFLFELPKQVSASMDQEICKGLGEK